MQQVEVRILGFRFKSYSSREAQDIMVSKDLTNYLTQFSPII